MKYKCRFTEKGGVYSLTFYDLTTKKEKEIIKIINSQGYKVKEVYNIKEQ
tara:strand:+ start:1716 stop:1865 length:150 start_codon:yes stop_codon:yes gene_type:complete